MNDAWKDVAGQFAQMGLPLLGRLLGGAIPVLGSFGGAALGENIGKIVAQAVAGALKVKATPEAVSAAIANGDTAEVMAKLRAVEAEAVVKWPALAEMEKSRDTADVETAKINATASADMRKNVAMNDFWPSMYRPLILWFAALNIIALGALLFWGLVFDSARLKLLIEAKELVGWWVGVLGVILGWHFSTRAIERKAALTEGAK